MALKLWKFLTTDIREWNWGQGVEVTKTGAEAAKAVFDLAKIVNEQKAKVQVQTLKPYVEQISSLLDVLNNPLAQIVKETIPFAPVAITILKLIFDITKKEPSLEQCVALVSQVAYLKSFQAILAEDPQLREQIDKSTSPASETVARQIKKLGEQELIDKREARKAIVYFHESKLAESFNEVLQQRLQESGLPETQAKTLTERVARKTNEYLFEALVEVGEPVKRLVEWYRVGGKEQLEKYLSIEDYLDREIKPKPDEIIFEDETRITFRNLYVSLKVKLLDDNGNPIEGEEPELEECVKKVLNDTDKKQQVLFIQGEAGRGKSVFCRIFADLVRQDLHPNYTPILIRLRELHRYAQTKDDLKDKITFCPCGQPDTEAFDRERLLRIIGYSHCLGVDSFNEILRFYLSRADLSGAVLSRADLRSAVLRSAVLRSADLRSADLSRAVLSRAVLSRADLSRADLSGADLSGAVLSGAVLRSAVLSRADLSRADLSGAVLSGADLSGAVLSGAVLSGAVLEALNWDSDTKWVNAKGLHEAVDVPSELAQQPAFAAAVSVSQGISWRKEGKLEEAFNAYNQALSLDPSLEKSAEFCNSFCWFGTLDGYAVDVLYLCENAVTLKPDNKNYQDSRGLAKALTDDLPGALEDFQAAVNSNALDYSQDVKQRRQRWIEALKAGQNPFTPEELEALRQAEG